MVYLIGHKDDNGEVLSFGTKDTFDPLLHCATRADGFYFTDIGQIVLTPAFYPGGYTVLFFDTAF